MGARGGEPPPGGGSSRGSGGSGRGRGGGAGRPSSSRRVVLGVATGAVATLLLGALSREGAGGLALRARWTEAGTAAGPGGGAGKMASERQLETRAHAGADSGASGSPSHSDSVDADVLPAGGSAEVEHRESSAVPAPVAKGPSSGSSDGAERVEAKAAAAKTDTSGATPGTRCAHGGQRSEPRAPCRCPPLFEGPLCETVASSSVTEKLLEGVVWELGMKRMKMGDVWSFGAPGAKQPWTERYLGSCALVSEAATLEQGQGEPVGAEIDRHDIVVRLAGNDPKEPQGSSPKEGLELVRQTLVRGEGARVGKRTTHVVVPSAWAEGLLATNTTEEPGLGPKSTRYLFFPDPAEEAARGATFFKDVNERLTSIGRGGKLQVVGRAVVDHGAAVRRRLQKNLYLHSSPTTGAQGDLRPEAVDRSPGLDFQALVFLSEVCGRVTVFGLAPGPLEVDVTAAGRRPSAALASLSSAGQVAEGPESQSAPALRDPLTATAAMLAQVGTGRVKLRLSEDWKDPHAPMPVFTMYSPKYKYYWDNLEASFARQAGKGWTLEASEIQDQAVNDGEGNKMKGNAFKVELILKELKARVGSEHPDFCWMDATALVTNPFLWRPLDGKDLYFVGESRFGNPEQMVNICFMCIKANARTLAFFEAVRKAIAEEGAWDQGRVNELLKAKEPPVSWGWLPPSTVQILAAPHDNCDPTRGAAVLKFISMATKNHVIPNQKRMQLYNSHFSAITSGTSLKCPKNLKNRADKEYKKVEHYRELARQKKAEEKRTRAKAAAAPKAASKAAAPEAAPVPHDSDAEAA